MTSDTFYIKRKYVYHRYLEKINCVAKSARFLWFFWLPFLTYKKINSITNLCKSACLLLYSCGIEQFWKLAKIFLHQVCKGEMTNLRFKLELLACEARMKFSRLISIIRCLSWSQCKSQKPCMFSMWHAIVHLNNIILDSFAVFFPLQYVKVQQHGNFHLSLLYYLVLCVQKARFVKQHKDFRLRRMYFITEHYMFTIKVRQRSQHDMAFDPLYSRVGVVVGLVFILLIQWNLLHRVKPLYRTRQICIELWISDTAKRIVLHKTCIRIDGLVLSHIRGATRTIPFFLYIRTYCGSFKKQSALSNMFLGAWSDIYMALSYIMKVGPNKSNNHCAKVGSLNYRQAYLGTRIITGCRRAAWDAFLLWLAHTINLIMFIAPNIGCK